MRIDMKRTLSRTLACLALGLSAPLYAAGGGALPYHYDPELRNDASLQRGAKLFMNYCAGCHGLELLRYNRMAEDLGIPEDLLTDNLIFTGAKPGEHMKTAMQSSDAEQWFGVAPPDLTLTARSKGPSWIYSYLLTFYVDDSRPMGVNNLVLPGASMPHVLAPLQGYQALDEHHAEDDHDKHHHEAHGRNHVIAKAAVLKIALTVAAALHTKCCRNYTANNLQRAGFFLVFFVGVCHFMSLTSQPILPFA